MQVSGQVGPQTLSDGVGTAEFRQTRTGEIAISQVHGRYHEQSRRGNIFMSRAVMTNPVAFGTAAGVGGPLLWNGSSTVNASLLAIVMGGITTAATIATSLGITGNTGQTAAPSSTTVIDSTAALYLGGTASACTTYRVGTVTNAGAFFLPMYGVDTATTAIAHVSGWIDLGGCITVPPNAWAAVASVAVTTSVMQLALIWEEVAV